MPGALGDRFIFFFAVLLEFLLSHRAARAVGILVQEGLALPDDAALIGRLYQGG